MDFSWDDLRLFLDVARLGGLSAAEWERVEGALAALERALGG